MGQDPGHPDLESEAFLDVASLAASLTILSAALMLSPDILVVSLHSITGYCQEIFLVNGHDPNGEEMQFIKLFGCAHNSIWLSAPLSN
jgi:hypothetical protein